MILRILESSLFIIINNKATVSILTYMKMLKLIQSQESDSMRIGQGQASMSLKNLKVIYKIMKTLKEKKRERMKMEETKASNNSNKSSK